VSEEIVTCVFMVVQEASPEDRGSWLNYAVIPRVTSDPANEISANEDFFAVFWTRLTNMDSANECFSGCAR